MRGPKCDICGKPKRRYEQGVEIVWKCMTSPKDHATIIDQKQRSKQGRTAGRMNKGRSSKRKGKKRGER